jgi:Flp pilus assembly protein TadD
MICQSDTVEVAQSPLKQDSSCDVRKVLPSEPAKDADQARSWSLYGLALFHRCDYALARAAFEHASTFAPLDENSTGALAECCLRTGRRSQAVNLYRDLASRPHCPTELLPSIAAGLGFAGDNQAALDVCRLAAEREPNCPEPHFGITFYLRRLGYPARVAIPYMARAFELSVGDDLYRCALAFLLAEDDRTEEASDLLQEIQVKGVGCPCAIRRMMAIFQRVGDYRRWSECRSQLTDLSKRA